ncbi:MAG: pantetheine-phosphate adenylyltransferase [Candidatus Eremiobacteraeota bacterium]|nr:pantetheine-phosphate adenylyltransferase [Candidatus Eremiobacteraeota bacterium]
MPHAVYPGSFDPLTNGHLDVIRRSAAVFDRLTVAVVVNPQKREPMFTLEERYAMLTECTNDLRNIEVADFRGLLADFVKEIGADVIVKGLRVISDFESELSTALMNRSLSDVDTMFLMSDARYSFVSSSLIKEVFLLGGDVSSYVPPPVLKMMNARHKKLRALRPTT